MRNLYVIVLVLMMGMGTLFADGAKVVYDLSSGDSKKIEKHLLKSLNAVAMHYKKEKKEFKAMVVISGDAYKYFVNDLAKSPYANQDEVSAIQPKFNKLLTMLNNEYDVTFNMCSAGMKARKITKNMLYKYVHADVTKSVYLIETQNNGYAYMPIH